ncbi:MAG: hypothetical protein U0360_02115 [Dehalococcoidia bacterium]
MSTRSSRIGFAVAVLFVLTEALAWYYAMHVFSSSYERAVLSDLAVRLDVATLPRIGPSPTAPRDDAGAPDAPAPRPLDAPEVRGLDAIAASRAAEVARTAAQSATAGPQWYVVLSVALLAFALTRFIRSSHLGGLGTLLGIVVSVAALSLAWRYVFIGDLRFWDYSAVARFFEDSESPGFRPIDVVAFAARPSADVASGRSQGLSLLGIGALWIRFLFAGRAPLQFETVLRSFSASFPVVLITTLAASSWAIPGAAVPVVYFTSAVLLLAVSNAGRATDGGAVAPLEAGAGLLARVRAFVANPWVFAATATLALLGSTALALVVLRELNAGQALLILGGYVGQAFEFVLLLIVTPIYWLLAAFSNWLGLEPIDLSFMSRNLDSARPDIPPDQVQPGGAFFWVGDALRLLALAALVYGVYRAARFMFARLESRRLENADGDRSAISSTAGFGSLLRAAFSRGGARDDGDARWLRRQPAYLLYGRMLEDTVERRFAPRRSETPLEFAAASAAALDASVFLPIAAEFDRARYGEHFASELELRPLAAALREWETANPVTEEVRRRPGRDEEAPQVELGPTAEVPEAPAELMPPV